jgi:hypothetical protein
MVDDDSGLLLKFKRILNISQKVKKSDVAESLGISQSELFERLIGWGEIIPFKIQDEYIIVEDTGKNIQKDIDNSVNLVKDKPKVKTFVWRKEKQTEVENQIPLKNEIQIQPKTEFQIPLKIKTQNQLKREQNLKLTQEKIKDVFEQIKEAIIGIICCILCIAFIIAVLAFLGDPEGTMNFLGPIIAGLCIISLIISTVSDTFNEQKQKSKSKK